MRLVLAVSAFLIVSHAAGATDAVFPSSAGDLKVQTVASGLVYPWSLAFLPDGRMLVAERPGRLRIIAADGRLSPPLGNVPKVYAVSQAGLMDILLARDFAQSHTIFVCYAEAAEGGGRIAVLRARLIEDESPRLDDVTVIFRQKGPVSRGLNIGCRMVQAQDDNLFVTLGDHFGPKELAQKLDNHMARLCASRPTGRRRPTTPLLGIGVLCLKSGPTACATRKVSPSIRQTESYGSRSTDPWVATRSTSSRKLKTTAGRV